MVVKVGKGSTFDETCLERGVQENCAKLTMLHGAKPAETLFAAPLHISLG